jgi:hypothetical protein
MDNKEVTDVNVESPAALNAEGIIKLIDQKRGCAIKEITIRVTIVEIIACGG